MKKSFAVTMCLASCLLIARAGWAQAPAPTTPPPPSNPPPSIVQGTDSGARTGNQGISAWAILPWGGYGLGARYMLPLPITPLLHHPVIHDSWALEFGADLLHWNYGFLANGNYSWNEVLPVVGMMWNVALTEQFTVYLKIEAGYAFGWYSGWNDQWGNRPTYGGIFVDGAAGVLYKVGGGLSLRAEVGYAGLKAGVGWIF
ncbi:MAG TPA: hypothetical protein VNO55_20675 [Polyangia bacterium]|nr:hypothetical protein [Polyangia bacterium]